MLGVASRQPFFTNGSTFLFIYQNFFGICFAFKLVHSKFKIMKHEAVQSLYNRINQSFVDHCNEAFVNNGLPSEEAKTKAIALAKAVLHDGKKFTEEIMKLKTN
jgi:hypothetical protein